MGILVLLSTTSFAVDKHYCGDFLVDMAILSEAETCDMQVPDHSHSGDALSSADEDFCCSNHKTVIEGQDELVSSVKSLEFNQQVFLSTLTYSYIDLFRISPEQVVPFKYYSSPLLVRDVQLLDQVFLI